MFYFYSKEYEDLSVKAKSMFSISLRSISQPMSLGEIARTWDVCARAVISEHAQQSGGGSFSSKYGTWENCLSAAWSILYLSPNKGIPRIVVITAVIFRCDVWSSFLIVYRQTCIGGTYLSLLWEIILGDLFNFLLVFVENAASSRFVTSVCKEYCVNIFLGLFIRWGYPSKE